MSSEMLDLIRDGVPPADLAARGGRATWDALGRTALAALNAGWSAAEWKGEVTRPISKLGHQLRVRPNGKEQSPVQVENSLDRAWSRAVVRAVESPAWNKDQARAEAERRAAAVMVVVADPSVDLSDNERALLNFAAAEAARLGSTQVNLPRLPTADAVELSPKAVRWNLDKLDRRGVLPCVAPGRARKNPGDRRSAVYRLPDETALRLALAPVLSRETRQVGPNDMTGGPLVSRTLGPEPMTGRPLQGRQFSAEEISRVLGGDAVAALEDADRPPLSSRDQDDHPLALVQECSLPPGHDPHPYGPISPGGGLAYWCPGGRDNANHYVGEVAA